MAFKFDLRKIIVIFLIAVLTAVLAYSITAAVMPKPQYEDFCTGEFYPRIEPMQPYKQIAPEYTCPAFDDTQAQECSKTKGMPEYKYNEYGCPIEMTRCNYCQNNFNEAEKKFNFILFVTDAIIAFIAIMVGLNLPDKKEVSTWIGTGLLFGGLISLFFGTVVYYTNLGRYIRPVVIFIELVLVIYLAYRKLSEK